MQSRMMFVGLFILVLSMTFPVITINPTFAQTQMVPVVILFNDKVTDAHLNLIKSNGGEVTRAYHIINGLAVNIPQTAIDGLKHNPLVRSVDPDVKMKAFDLNADTQIKANQVWTSATGQGVHVAILDTGIDTTHPEFSGRIVSCHSEITNTNTCDDQNGHGTHVAGIAGAAGINTNAKGVAPSISLDIDQVLDSTGTGSLSGIIAGIDYATANGDKVISMSLGTDPLSTSQPNCDTTIPSLTSAINNAISSGVTVVAAAGNSGQQGVGAPGCISSTIVVGDVDGTDQIASSSSTGGPMADHGIVAPGVNIFSSYLGGGYATLSGTSMATPHVAGTIGLMLQSNPTLTPTQIKNILFSNTCSGITNPSCPTGTVPNTVYGYGRVDALKAFDTIVPPAPDFTISTSPASLTIPAGASANSTITVTSLNGFSGTVSLATSVSDPSVTSALGSSLLAINSGGSNSSTLSISASTTGTYTVTVTGTSGSLTHNTPVTVTILSLPPTNVSTDNQTNTNQTNSISETNMGQQIADFVHQSNALFKQQREETINAIKECHEKIRNASTDNRTQVIDECRSTMKNIKEKFQDVRNQFHELFKQFGGSMTVLRQDTQGFKISEQDKARAIENINKDASKHGLAGIQTALEHVGGMGEAGNVGIERALQHINETGTGSMENNSSMSSATQEQSSNQSSHGPPFSSSDQSSHGPPFSSSDQSSHGPPFSSSDQSSHGPPFLPGSQGPHGRP